MSRRRKGRGARPLASLFEDILPRDFSRQRVLIEQYQQFFNQLDSEVFFQAVRVQHVGEEELSVALPSPAYANRLRQHQPALEQALAEQFGRRLRLRIRVDPSLMTPPDKPQHMPPPRLPSEQTRQRIASSARSLEDEELSRALHRLAETLGKKG